MPPKRSGKKGGKDQTAPPPRKTRRTSKSGSKKEEQPAKSGGNKKQEQKKSAVKKDETTKKPETQRDVGTPNQTLYIKNLNDKLRKDGKCFYCHMGNSLLIHACRVEKQPLFIILDLWTYH